MPALECPHCHLVVLVREGGNCPSCGKDPADPLGATPSLTRLTFHLGLATPALCCTCGCATASREEVVASRTVGGEGLVARLLFPLAVLFQLTSMRHAGSVYGRAQRVAFAAPRCPDCQASGRLVPEHVDWEERTLDLLVCRAFAEVASRGGWATGTQAPSNATPAPPMGA